MTPGSWKSLAWWLVALVAVLHVGFMLLEMFRWEWLAQRVAGLTETVAQATTRIGMNQGLYNGFLAAGLAWSLSWSARPNFDRQRAMFFLACVAVAGIFGAITINPKGFYTGLLVGQALPALIAILAVWKAK